ESFNATLKREVLRDRKVFDNPIICRQEVFRWCMRYNTRRRHSLKRPGFSSASFTALR
ncbi:integrase core domain-containing protein, partial [Corynebacterium striatum]